MYINIYIYNKKIKNRKVRERYLILSLNCNTQHLRIPRGSCDLVIFELLDRFDYRKLLMYVKRTRPDRQSTHVSSSTNHYQHPSHPQHNLTHIASPELSSAFNQAPSSQKTKPNNTIQPSQNTTTTKTHEFNSSVNPRFKIHKNLTLTALGTELLLCPSYRTPQKQPLTQTSPHKTSDCNVTDARECQKRRKFRKTKPKSPDSPLSFKFLQQFDWKQEGNC